jgi:hypothetical protein
MAASITGTFTIIDRASGPMRRMEAQAAKTMAAIEGVGKANDKSAQNQNRAGRAAQQQERAMRNVARAAKVQENDTKRLSDRTREFEHRAHSLEQRLVRLGSVFLGLKVILTSVKFTVIAVGVSVLAQAVGVLAGGVTALIPALVSAGGALAALPQAAAAAAQGFLGVKLALGGVMDALKAGMTMQQQSGQVATQMADQHRQAAAAIRSANRGVEMAARGVEDAEWNVQLAQRSSFDAQRQLNEARIEATRSLQDMRMAAQSAALGEERAALSLRQAKLSLAQRAIDPTATALDMQDSSLAVREAQLNLRAQKREANRAQQDMRRSNRRGVSGSDTMISARRGVIDAARGQEQAALGVADALYAQEDAAIALADAQRQATQSARQGTTQQNAMKQAMKELSPEAQSFVKHVLAMRPAFMDLRAAIGRDLFPQLERGMDNLMRAAPMLERVWRGTGAVVGEAFKDITGRMTSDKRLKDWETLGRSNNKMLHRMGEALGNVSEGMLDLMIAARPLTRWLSETILGWSELFEKSMKTGRATGELGERFERTRFVLERFGRILSNLWDTFQGIGQAARPLGERLWDGAERATEGWAHFFDEAENVEKVQHGFDKLYRPLHLMGQLIKELGLAWADVTVHSTKYLNKTIQELRKGVPYLAKTLTALSHLGPLFAKTLTQVIRLLSNVPHTPLIAVMTLFNNMLKVLNDILEISPLIAQGFAVFLEIATIAKFASWITTLAERWGLVGSAAARAAAAQRAASMPMGPGAGPTARSVPAPMYGGAPAGPARLGFGGGFRAGMGGARPSGAMTGMGRFGARLGGLGARIPGASTIGGIGGALGKMPGAGLVGGAARFLGPVGMALTAGFGINAAVNTKGKNMGFDDRMQNAGSAMTFGLIPAAKKMSELKAEGAAAVMEELDGTETLKELGEGRLGVESAIAAIQSSDLPGSVQEEMLAKLQGQLEALKGIESKQRDIAKQRDIVKAEELMGGGPQSFNKLFDTILKGSGNAEKALGESSQAMIGKLGHLRDEGSQRLGQLYLNMAREQAKRHPELRDNVAKLTDRMEAKWRSAGKEIFVISGRVVRNVPEVWDKLYDRLDSRTEKWRQRNQNKFTRTQEDFRKMLVKMNGLTRGVADVIVQSREDGTTGTAQERYAIDSAKKEREGHKSELDKMLEDRTSILKKMLNVTDKVTKAQKDLATGNSGATREKLAADNERIKESSDNNWTRVKDIIGDMTDKARDVATDNFGFLREDAIKALMGMGFSKGEAEKAVAGKEAGASKGGGGKKKTTAAYGARVLYHGGGRLGGTGLQDNIEVAPGHLAAPGELIVNRHTEDRINNKLAGKTTLAAEVAGEGRPHSAPRRGRPSWMTRHATGGVAQPPGDPGAEVVQAGYEQEVGAFLRRFGMDLTQGYGGASSPSVSPGHTTLGVPPSLDVVPMDGNWDGAFASGLKWALAQGMNTLYDGQYGTTAWPDHGEGNHAHIDWGGGGGKLPAGSAAAMGITGKQMRSLRLPPAASGGAPAAMVNQLTMHMARALEAKLGAGGGVPFGGSVPVKLPTALQKYNKQYPEAPAPTHVNAPKMPLDAVSALAEWAGGGAVPGVSMGKTAVGESALAPGASGIDPGGTKGLGLYMITTGFNDPLIAKLGGQDAMFNPVVNSQAMAEIFKSQGIGAWYSQTKDNSNTHYTGPLLNATGGRVGRRGMAWGGMHGVGLDATVGKPTAFGAGESGEERVQITPKMRSSAKGPRKGGGPNKSGKGHGVTVHIGHIDYRREGDIKEAIEKEMAGLAQDLELSPLDDD